jgi:hypothetical protein
MHDADKFLVGGTSAGHFTRKAVYLPKPIRRISGSNTVLGFGVQ